MYQLKINNFKLNEENGTKLNSVIFSYYELLYQQNLQSTQSTSIKQAFREHLKDQIEREQSDFVIPSKPKILRLVM